MLPLATRAVKNVKAREVSILEPEPVHSYFMKPRTKEVGKAGRVVANLLVHLAQTKGFTYRAIAADTGMSINRIGIIFRNEGPAVEIDELFALCSVFKIEPSIVTAATEWAVDGQPPEGLTKQEQIEVAALYEAVVKREA